MGGEEQLYSHTRGKKTRGLKCIQDLEAHNTDVVSIATNILQSREKTRVGILKDSTTYRLKADIAYQLMNLHSLSQEVSLVKESRSSEITLLRK